MKHSFKRIISVFVLCTAIYAGANAQIVVNIRPVAPVIVTPVPPSPRHIWVDGEWRWQGGRYVYTNGYWVMPARGRAWKAGYWKRHRHGWVWKPGHWRR